MRPALLVRWPLSAEWIYERYPFGTLAGNSPSAGSRDGVAKDARFRSPRGIAIDSAGNVYVADGGNQAVRKLGRGGEVRTVARFVPGGYTNDGAPQGVAVDSSGNVYLSDPSSNVVHKLAPNGSLSVYAGRAFTSIFSAPAGLAVDAAGNVYVADSGLNRIRKITLAATVSTLAGGGPGSTDGSGNSAQFKAPNGVAVDANGTVYVADTGNHTIRRITPAGDVTTLAGIAGVPGTADGAGTAARFYAPEGIAVDSAGNVFVADTASHTIRKVTPAGLVSTIAGQGGNPGSSDGIGAAARFEKPAGIHVDAAGNLYVSDMVNNTIRKIAAAGEVSTIAGSAGNVQSADGVGRDAHFGRPNAVAVDRDRNLYVGDSGYGDVRVRSNQCSAVRKISPAGVVTTLAGSLLSQGSADGTGSNARFGYIEGLAVDDGGNVYVADGGKQALRKVTPEGGVTTLPFAIGYPSDVALDRSGNIYVAANNTIRKITPAGEMSTLAGSAGFSGHADGPGETALFVGPTGITVDDAGNVLVADPYAIRKVTPAGFVSTIAGGGRGSSDGQGAAARFSFAAGIDVDTLGNVYVADYYNSTIRKITPGGDVKTIAGAPTGYGDPDNVGVRSDGSRDGVGSAARFTIPADVAVGRDGRIYVADSQDLTIRVGGPSAVPQSMNLSTRVRVSTGDEALIGGFITTGNVSKRVLLRAIGPSLARGSVPGHLPDPILELRDSSGAEIAKNDNWQQGADVAEIETLGLSPLHRLESALVATLSPNRAYTAVVRGQDVGEGVALVEAYDLNSAADAVLANVSTRGMVRTGDDVMIAGFILGGGTARSAVLIRAVGPSLAAAGIASALSDPVLQLHDRNGDVLASNDDWAESADAGAVESIGIPPSDTREAAILAMLPAGNYTAIVTGKSAGTGMALIEVYNLQ